MDCPACPLTIKIALKNVKGVQSVEVDYKNKRASVAFDDAKATLEDLRNATADAGYPSMPVKGN